MPVGNEPGKEQDADTQEKLSGVLHVVQVKKVPRSMTGTVCAP
jgi:hypothetical protein